MPDAIVTTLSDSDYTQSAARIDPAMSPLLLRAFAEVESGGRSGFGPAGLPVIAYEGHIFRKYTKSKYDAQYPLLSYPYKVKAGPEWKQNNKDQATAYQTLAAASALDADAAQMACSWGMFQVMGFNYADCGYGDVGAFVTGMKSGAKAHIDAFVAFCLKRKGMKAAMLGKQYATMATLYNGPNFGDYDKRIEKAYTRLGGK